MEDSKNTSASATDDNVNDGGVGDGAVRDAEDTETGFRSRTDHKTEAEALDERWQQRSLTRQEIWNLTFALLAWACTVSVVTLVVGTSAVVLIVIGGDNSLTSLPLGTFVFGSSMASLLVTPWLFVKWGRMRGFFLGISFGMVGTIVSMLSIQFDSVPLLIIAMIFFGMAMGVGFFLRFAAVEVVPSHWTTKAVTLVVSGGVIAAFSGPESARATKDMFDHEYMGIFFMTGVFNVANAICICLISFPAPPQVKTVPNDESALDKEADEAAFYALLKSRQFLVPMLVATLAWSCMLMPMSIVRVIMAQVGFTSRESLTTIEFHFVGMYAPGFITGPLIAKYGPLRNVMAGIVIFAFALLCNFLADEKDGDKKKLALWVIGLFLLGVAWNFCFTSATIWTTALYNQQPQLKPRVQAANDCSMFLLSGVWLVSASYIFEKGGSELDGWHVLNWVVVGLVACMGVVLAADLFMSSLESRMDGEAQEQKQPLPEALD